MIRSWNTKHTKEKTILNSWETKSFTRKEKYSRYTVPGFTVNNTDTVTMMQCLHSDLTKIML